jgi:hypothetical protein
MGNKKILREYHTAAKLFACWHGYTVCKKSACHTGFLFFDPDRKRWEFASTGLIQRLWKKRKKGEMKNAEQARQQTDS